MVSFRVRGTRGGGTYSHHRAHSAFHGGSGTTERVIKMCIVAFPSIWVSCKTRVLNCLLLKEDCYLVLGQSALAYCVIMCRIFILLSRRSLSFGLLACLSLFAFQWVSAPRSLARSLSFRVLTCPSFCALKFVSIPCSLTFFPLDVPLRPSGCEFP